MPERSILIAGGGASGALLTARLLRESPDVRVTVIEPRASLGRGMAYSTPHDVHLLNVPAARMSAFPEEPDHFVRFLNERYPGRYQPASFVSRRIYGDYLASVVTQAVESSGGRADHERAQALAASIDGNGVRIVCDGGRTLRGDALVLATGNADPAPWVDAGSDVQIGAHYFPSVWAPGATEPFDPDAEVLLLGTGLTAVDAVLALRENGQRAPIWMISRRGLLPHEHRVFDAPPASNPDAASMHELLRNVRQGTRHPRAWRAALDALRPHTNRLWQGLSVNDQRRFVRHLMPYWNAHRHRMAPEIAQTIAGGIAGGWLRMLAGRTGRIELGANGLHVPIVMRGSGKRIELEVGRIINCSGPAHDPRVLDNPLIGNLLAQGLMAPAPLGIGADVAASGAVRDRRGVDSDRIFAIGPVRYGTLIETTAMPEIRVQAAELARHLLQSSG